MLMMKGNDTNFKLPCLHWLPKMLGNQGVTKNTCNIMPNGNVSNSAFLSNHWVPKMLGIQGVTKNTCNIRPNWNVSNSAFLSIHWVPKMLGIQGTTKITCSSMPKRSALHNATLSSLPEADHIKKHNFVTKLHNYVLIIVNHQITVILTKLSYNVSILLICCILPVKVFKIKLRFYLTKFCISIYFFSLITLPWHDTSFLKQNLLLISGDVESNPGPIASAQAHRLAIGSYYDKAVKLSRATHVCFCQKYEDMVFRYSGYNFNTVIEFFSNHFVKANNNGTYESLEFCIALIELVYDVSFLTILQLIIHGDVELNPGPIENQKATAKRRNKKKTTFNFSKKKLDMDSVKQDVIQLSNSSVEENDKCVVVGNSSSVNDIDLVIEQPMKLSDAEQNSILVSNETSDTYTLSLTRRSFLSRNFPVKLENNGVNICFFNSNLQILYSIFEFHAFIEECSLLNPNNNIEDTRYNTVCLLQTIFRAMRDANEPVQTFAFIRQLNLPGYNFGLQYDAEECLTNILDKCFPNVTDSIFCIKVNESILCEEAPIPNTPGGCGAKQDKFETHQIFKLNVQEFTYQQSVQEMLNSTYNFEVMDDYRCSIGENNGCQKAGFCKKSTIIAELKDLIIIQLKIFNSQLMKIFPAIKVDQVITPFDTYELIGILWHHGRSMNSGHYTSMVKRNDQWLHISDSDLYGYPVTFSCRSGNESVPYLLFYKRFTSNPISVSTMSINDNPKKSSHNERDSDVSKINEGDNENKMLPEVEEISESETCFVTPQKYNFSKKRIRLTLNPKDEINNLKWARDGMSKIRKTDAGQVKNRQTAKDGMKRY